MQRESDKMCCFFILTLSNGFYYVRSFSVDLFTLWAYAFPKRLTLIPWTDGQIMEVAVIGRRFICCDKAVRSDATTFVICGATARLYGKKIKGYNDVTRNVWRPLEVRIDGDKSKHPKTKANPVPKKQPGVKVVENGTENDSENVTEGMTLPRSETAGIGFLVIGPVIPL